MKTVNLENNLFGRLTAIKHVDTKHAKKLWLCKCVCGNYVKVSSGDLLRGHTKSCGCLAIERAKISNTTHGMRQSSFYIIWISMKGRCLNPKNSSYSNYGGRGIVVCNRWLDFENFKDDMYESYLEHGKLYGFGINTSLDRYPNNDGNYEPSNVRWATRVEQARHTRVSTKSENYDEHYRIERLFQGMLNRCLKNNQDTALFFARFGCSLLKFKQHIESQFQEGMTWNNWGKGEGKWELDHIISCYRFDLSKEEDKVACFNYTNYQPLWREDNWSKR